MMLVIAVVVILLVVFGVGVDGGFGGIWERLEAQDRNLVTLLNPSTPLAHSWWSIDGGITITLSSTGQLVSMPWPTPGLPLNFLT